MTALWIGAWDPAEDGREPEQEAPEEETFDSFSLAWYERRRASGGRNGTGSPRAAKRISLNAATTC